MSSDGSERAGWHSPPCLRWFLSLAAAGGASPSCSPLAPWNVPPACARAARESWTPALPHHPSARLMCSPASCRTAGQAAVPGCARTAHGCARLCGQCLVTQVSTHSPQTGLQSAVGWWGSWGEGDTSLLPAQPWGTVHMCVPTCAACMPVCTVSERDMHTCTCALSACVLCYEIPLPVQAACPHLPVRAQCLALSLAMATRGTLQALSHSKCLPGPRVPTVPTLDMTALCAYRLGQPQAAPASPSLGPTPHYPHG